MSTANVRSVSIAAEATFGSVDAATGLPDITALTFASLEIEDRAALTTIGDPQMTAREAIARDNYYIDPPEPATILSSGNRVRRWKGDLTVAVPLRPKGTSGNYTSMPLSKVLNSGFSVQDAAVDATDLIAAGVSATEWTPTALGDYVLGQLVKLDIAGRPEYVQVTDSPANIRCSPAFSTTPSGTVRQMRTWYVGPAATIGASIAATVNGDGWRAEATGGRLKSIKVTLNDAKMAVAELTIQFAYIRTDHAAYDVDRPAKTDGAVPHALGSYAVRSSAASNPGTAAPYTLARTAETLDEFTFEVVNTLVERGQSDSIVGVVDMDVVDVSATVELISNAPSTTMDSDFLTQTGRSIFLGLSATGAGNGCCLAIPNGILTTDAAARDLGNGLVRQKRSYKAGVWQGVDATTPLATSPVLIGLSL